MSAKSLRQLNTCIPPPRDPIGDFDETTLEKLQRTVPFRFPNDFLSWCRQYGTGHLNFKHDEEGTDTLRITGPFDPNYSRWVLESIDDFVSVDPENMRESEFCPSVNRVVPFARSMSGEMLYLGKDKRRTSVLWIPDCRPQHTVVWPMSFSEFMTGLVTGTIEPEVFYENSIIVETSLEFEPFNWLYPFE